LIAVYNRICDGRNRGCIFSPDIPLCQSHLYALMESPSILTPIGKGIFLWTPLHKNESCPETHYRCPGPVAYCMPVYTRCNGYYDCPGREDEAE
jgi:hypothetical protein